MPQQRPRRADTLRADRRGVTVLEYAVVTGVVLAAVTLAFPLFADMMASRIAVLVAAI